MRLRIRGRWRRRKKRLRDAAQDPGLGLERAPARVDGQRLVGRPEGQRVPQGAIEARQVVVMVASDEVAEDAATMALVAEPPVSRAGAASAAVDWAE